MRLVDERKLLERAQSSTTGFGELFDQCYDRIYKYAYRRVGSREIAEDIAANVFEEAMREIQRVRWQGKPVIAWLYRITSRRIADYYRARKDNASLDNIVIAIDDRAHESVERAEEFAAVQRGLKKLSARDREIILLAYFDELSGAEIAAALDCTPNTAYVRLHRAVEKLERMVRDEIG
jgi:RNA polymerase sigma-70 factor (ECF subfamily)